MRGRWAQGLEPRFFCWIIKDRLAGSERPGGFARNHRKVRRQEELIWLRQHDFTHVISLLDSSHNLPAYDEALLARELRLFDEWFLGRHLGMALDCGDLEALDLAYRRLVDAALAQPQVLVHRDFMPRNLMPVAGGAAVLDFQDAVRGPIAYDPLSQLRKASLNRFT